MELIDTLRVWTTYILTVLPLLMLGVTALLLICAMLVYMLADPWLK